MAKKTKENKNLQKPKKKGKGRCKFCGSSDFGFNCRYSPYEKHQHEHSPSSGDYEYCVWCGSKGYGTGCVYSPVEETYNKKLHKHFSDGIHCIWCGVKLVDEYGKPIPGMTGAGCKYSPNRYHSL